MDAWNTSFLLEWQGLCYSSFREGTNFVKARIWGDGRRNRGEDVGGGATGSVFVQWRVRIYEMTNWDMLRHDFQLHPCSCNFNLVQDPTHGTPNLKLARSISLYIWIWSVIYQSSMTLFKLNDFSNQCPQLAWGPEHLVSPTRRNEIHQIDPNGTKPKRVNHLGWFFPPFWFLELFGSLTSQSLLEYVGISHWLWLQVSDTQNEGFMVSPFLVLVFSQRHEHCNYHLQLLWTCLITTFLPCHLLPLRKMCVSS